MPRDDDHPVRRVPVEHERLLTREHPVGALAPGPGVHTVDGIVVAELLERDRAPDRARRELREQVGVLEPASRERGEDRRREERARERQAPHLLHHDGHVDEPETEAAVRLGDEQAGPSELGKLVPHRVGEAAFVVGHLAHVPARRLAREERAHRLAQRVLIVAEGEIQGNAASRET